MNSNINFGDKAALTHIHTQKTTLERCRNPPTNMDGGDDDQQRHEPRKHEHEQTHKH